MPGKNASEKTGGRDENIAKERRRLVARGNAKEKLCAALRGKGDALFRAAYHGKEREARGAERTRIAKEKHGDDLQWKGIALGRSELQRKR